MRGPRCVIPRYVGFDDLSVFQTLDAETRRFLNDERCALAVDSTAGLARAREETATEGRRIERQEKLLRVSVRALVGIHEFADRFAEGNRVYPHASRDAREYSVELRMTIVPSARACAAQSGVPR